MSMCAPNPPPQNTVFLRKEYKLATLDILNLPPVNKEGLLYPKQGCGQEALLLSMLPSSTLLSKYGHFLL